MTTDTQRIDSNAVRDRFEQWRADQEPLAVELNESLAALAAFQSHLDTWQQQLVRERDELHRARDSFAGEQAAAKEARGASLEAHAAELHAARDKIASLTSALLARTDELRALDGHRAEVATELELARAREEELRTKLADQKQSREEERAQWSSELRHLRELLALRLETGSIEDHAVDTEPSPAKRSPAGAAGRAASNSPVLGSIVEQFGKLRQQRSLDRSSPNKPR